MVTGDYGSCKNCGKRTELGDGLCVECWDKRVDNWHGTLPKGVTGRPPVSSTTLVSEQVPMTEFTDKYGRKWGKWWNGCIGVIKE